jgi:hypothetical protein
MRSPFIHATLPLLLASAFLSGAVLTQARAQTLPPGMPPPPPSEPVNYLAAAEVNDGVWHVDAASQATLSAPGATGRLARSLQMRVTADRVNGLYVHGQSDFTLRDAGIELSGQGLSDFDGIAAGVLVRDKAHLAMRGGRVTTRGAVSTALSATDQATIRVDGVTLQAFGGPLPSAYVRRIGLGMMEPPTPLGIVGTARTVLVMGESRAYFTRSTIVAEGWGALSTDAARGAYLEADQCDIRVLRSGYGTYADNGATVRIRNSRMEVPTFGGVIAGQASLSLENVRSTSGGNTVMVHSVMGQPTELATLRIMGGDLQSTNAAIVVKSANADIVVDAARIRARNKDILLGVKNDDGFATKVNGELVHGIQAEVRRSQLNGNLIHLDPERAMRVTLTESQLHGQVRNVKLVMDARSRWTATADSTLTGLVLGDWGQVDAKQGVTIRVKAGEGSLPIGTHVLAHGGRLLVE